MILEYLRKNKVNSFWHFTDIRNLPFIKLFKGLGSKEFLEDNGIFDEVYYNGNVVSHQLDKNLNNWDKISLNFTPQTPFAYHKKRKNHLVFIEICPEVALISDVYFCDCNADRTRNNVKRESGIVGLKNIKFNIIMVNHHLGMKIG